MRSETCCTWRCRDGCRAGGFGGVGGSGIVRYGRGRGGRRVKSVEARER